MASDDDRDASLSARSEAGHTLLVGRYSWAEETGTDQLGVRRAAPWPYSLSQAMENAIGERPYLYLYRGLPDQQLTRRYRIVGHKTSAGAEGIGCPWTEHADESYRGATRRGRYKFKTWFLLDDGQECAIRLEELERADGIRASPGKMAQDLKATFGLWRLGEAQGRPSRMIERTQANPPPEGASPGGQLSAAGLSELFGKTHGLYFTPYQVASFITALEAKGFVILSGVSGTGKTQLAVRIAQLVRGVAPEVIPVRPDWRDSRSLLGYYNPISEQYVSTSLLRQLLPDRTPAAEIPAAPPEVDFNAVRDRVLAHRNDWIPGLRSIVERLEHADPSTMSEDDLDLIWRRKSNGIASIGQAIAHALSADEAIVREATKRLTTSASPGQRLIDTLHYLHDQGNPWHWARTMRALAAFEIDRTSTIADPGALRRALAALGYGRRFDLGEAVRRRDAETIDGALQFLRRRIDEELEGLDRFEKAIAPWIIYEQLVSPGDSLTVVDHRFIILDEMNLARVEYYFAEFLSVLESDPDPETLVTTQALPLHDEPGPVKDGSKDAPAANDIPSRLPLPPYLYVVGTVNTDETTHAFSPKVLDRAFSIEFSEVDLRKAVSRGEWEDTSGIGQALARLLGGVSPDGNKQALERAIKDGRFLNWLEALNIRLQPYDLHFAYRVRDEIARFVGYAMVSPLSDGFREDGEDTFVGSFDAAVLMKVLPKFHGPSAKVRDPLTSVLGWATDPDRPDDATEDIRRALNVAEGLSVEALLEAARGNARLKLPRVVRKTARMLWEAATTGFTSFA
ncbi:MAG: hypothetical protein WBF66_09045 [Dehalococcoidia bacterium]